MQLINVLSEWSSSRNFTSSLSDSKINFARVIRNLSNRDQHQCTFTDKRWSIMYYALDQYAEYTTHLLVSPRIMAAIKLESRSSLRGYPLHSISLPRMEVSSQRLRVLFLLQ